MALGVRLIFAAAQGVLEPNPRVRRTRNIRVPMDDGVTLETEHFAPDRARPAPTVLTRIPYGIVGFRGMAEIYAEHGFNVVLQACRGTARSEGEFEPLVNERADGLATLRWIREQPWFDGRLGGQRPELCRLRDLGDRRCARDQGAVGEIDRGGFPARSSFPAAASTSGCG